MSRRKPLAAPDDAPPDNAAAEGRDAGPRKSGISKGGIIAEGSEYNIWIPLSNTTVPSVKSAEVVAKPICCK
jgi:hypothetical protein